MPRLVLATRNRKKRSELEALLRGLLVELGDLNDFPDAPDVVEDGGSFSANARLKATQIARFANAWALADDSGLVVPLLGGAPGVDSALYAGTHGDDAANNAKLIAEVQARGITATPAHYVCVLVLADATGTVRAEAEGRCHGEIVTQPQGPGGFGYDPLFRVPEYHATFGQLSATVKAAIGHRARALERLLPALRSIFAA